MAVNEIATILLLGSFAFLILLRVPIGFSLGLSSIITTIYLDLPLMVVAQGIVRGMDAFVLLAVPFFIIAGEIMVPAGFLPGLLIWPTLWSAGSAAVWPWSMFWPACFLAVSPALRLRILRRSAPC